MPEFLRSQNGSTNAQSHSESARHDLIGGRSGSARTNSRLDQLAGHGNGKRDFRYCYDMSFAEWAAMEKREAESGTGLAGPKSTGEEYQ